MTKYDITFRIECNDAVSIPDLRNYIKTEVEAGGGCRHPTDPLFDTKKLTCIKIERVRT